jgi:hypothetical protein|tara:strand:- start:3753 stop:4133 length:381 start_codon:yes stop_codon:yes gene_type:complete
MVDTYELTNDIGKVRFLIPDTDITDAELSDAEVTHLLSISGGTVNAAAIAGCRWLSRKYAQQITHTTEGGARFDLSKRAETYAARAKELEDQLIGGASFVGLDREDGYSEEATDSEYATRRVYIEV